MQTAQNPKTPNVFVTHRRPLKFVLGLAIFAAMIVFFGWLLLMDSQTATEMFESKRRGSSMMMLRYLSGPFLLFFGAYFVQIVRHTLEGKAVFRADEKGIQALDALTGTVELQWAEISAIAFGEEQIGNRKVPVIRFFQDKPLKRAAFYASRDTNPLIVNLTGQKETTQDFQKWLAALPSAASKIKSSADAA